MDIAKEFLDLKSMVYIEKIYIYIYYKVTICSPNPDELGYKPNEPNTINLQRVGERTELLAK